MTTQNKMQIGAERAIQAKAAFDETGEKNTDRVALTVLSLLEEGEILDDNSFKRMLEFAIQVYLIKMKSETSPISLITKLRQLPTSSLVGDYRNIEIRVLFFNNLERLLGIANQDDMAERIGFSSRAHYSRVKNGNTGISRKFEERLVDILEDLIHKD